MSVCQEGGGEESSGEEGEDPSDQPGDEKSEEEEYSDEDSDEEVSGRRVKCVAVMKELNISDSERKRGTAEKDQISQESECVLLLV